MELIFQIATQIAVMGAAWGAIRADIKYIHHQFKETSKEIERVEKRGEYYHHRFDAHIDNHAKVS